MKVVEVECRSYLIATSFLAILSSIRFDTALQLNAVECSCCSQPGQLEQLIEDYTRNYFKKKFSLLAEITFISDFFFYFIIFV